MEKESEMSPYIVKHGELFNGLRLPLGWEYTSTHRQQSAGPTPSLRRDSTMEYCWDTEWTQESNGLACTLWQISRILPILRCTKKRQVHRVLIV